jgi:hypothetical protein
MPEHESHQPDYRHPQFTESDHAKELLRNPLTPQGKFFKDENGRRDEQAYSAAIESHTRALEGLREEDGLSGAEIQDLRDTAEAIVKEAYEENNDIDQMKDAQRRDHLEELRNNNERARFNELQDAIITEQTLLGLQERAKRTAETGETPLMEEALTSETIAGAFNTGTIPPVVFISGRRDGNMHVGIIDGEVPAIYNDKRGGTSPLFQAVSYRQEGETKVRIFLNPDYNNYSVPFEARDPSVKLNTLTFPVGGTGPNFSRDIATLQRAMESRK